MHTVSHHGFSGPFGRSNEPRSEHTPHFDDFRVLFHFLGDRNSDVKNAKFVRGRPSRRCLCIRLAIMACPTHVEGQTSPEASIPLISMIFLCYSTPLDSDVKYTKFFRGRPSRPFLCIRLAITVCLTHLEGQTSPEASIPLISTIFVCYSTPFFG